MSDEKLRMCAYYYGFDETGCREVDLVLSAVACAGKAYHHTDKWSDPNDDGEPSEVERIQAAANAAAATIADLRDRLRIMAPMVCEGCGCAPAGEGSLCEDCDNVEWTDDHVREQSTDVGRGYHNAACISVGLRALCGRKLLEGCE